MVSRERRSRILFSKASPREVDHIKLSHDTALRDIHDLTDQGILTKDPAGGRSTSYSLKATYNPLAFRLLK
jgi:hypothetical protein